MIGESISHYTILDEIGEGGVAVVYKDEDTKLKRTVALKFLPRELMREKEAKARFIREAQTAAALDHPHIATIFEINEEDERVYISMALIEGQNLREKIAQGPLKIEEAVDIAIQVAEGLKAAHALVYNNRLKEAKKLLDSMAEKYSDQPFALLGTALRYTIIKEKQEALKSITENVEKAAEMDHVLAWWLADVYALIGEKEKAIYYLERATRENINYPLFSKYDPLLENIRGEKRFKKLMVRVKNEWENFEV